MSGEFIKCDTLAARTVCKCLAIEYLDFFCVLCVSALHTELNMHWIRMNSITWKICIKWNKMRKKIIEITREQKKWLIDFLWWNTKPKTYVTRCTETKHSRMKRAPVERRIKKKNIIKNSIVFSTRVNMYFNYNNICIVLKTIERHNRKKILVRSCAYMAHTYSPDTSNIEREKIQQRKNERNDVHMNIPTDRRRARWIRDECVWLIMRARTKCDRETRLKNTRTKAMAKRKERQQPGNAFIYYECNKLIRVKKKSERIEAGRSRTASYKVRDARCQWAGEL